MDVESPSTELSKLGAEALRDLYNNLAGVKAFALEQAPDVCQQMIQWEIACGYMAAAISAAMTVVCVLAIRKIGRAKEWEAGDPDFLFPTLMVAGTWMCIVGIAMGQVVAASKAYIAPKLFLLEKIAAMLKGMS